MGIFCEVELAHWQTMDAENWNMDTNSHNDDMREHVLSVMRCLEAHVNENEGINIPSPLQTPRIEEDHLVSTVTVYPQWPPLIQEGTSFQHRLPMELETLLENVDLSQLDDRWRGEHVHARGFPIESEDEEPQVYRTTFRFPQNIIVVRSIQDLRHRANHYIQTQIIWSSRFTWREIKQHVKDNTYNFDFRSENISIGLTSIREFSPLNSEVGVAVDEEIPNSLLEAVDGLPEVQICNESENDADGEIWPICHDTFSSVELAKQ